jgi:hypothetical protein
VSYAKIGNQKNETEVEKNENEVEKNENEVEWCAS